VGNSFPVAGGFAQVHAVTGPPEPYNEFSQEWLSFVSKNHGKIVKTVQETPLAHAPDGVLSEIWLDGWTVADPGYPQDGTYFPQQGECASWVPAEWLRPVPVSFSCNCSTHRLMTQGCQISWHK